MRDKINNEDMIDYLKNDYETKEWTLEQPAIPNRSHSIDK